MNGGPSQVDTFDPKPDADKYARRATRPPGHAGRRKDGNLMPSPFQFRQVRPERHRGQRAVPARRASASTTSASSARCTPTTPTTSRRLLMMNSGNMQPIRPSLGSWLTYGLGTENQNLPGFVVLCPGKPVVGPQLWSNSFLPGIYQGTHINNSDDRPEDRSSATSTTGYLAATAQREQLDLLQQLNQQHLEPARPRRASSKPASQSLEMAFRMQFEAQEAFDLGRETGSDAQAVRRGRVRRRLPARPAAGRARRAHGADLLRQRPAVGRPRRHHATTATTPRRATSRSPRCSPT